MYLQITTRCNMTCAHCCFSATHEGTDMPRETLMAALKLADSMGEYLTLGGGEPTVHPHFFDYLGLAMAYNPEPSSPVLVVTNGKRRDIALRLAEMARNGLIQADLSQDDWHDPISKEVVVAFNRPKRGYGHDGDRDARGIRDVQVIVPVGRAIDLNVATVDEGCCCETPLVDPEGRLWACGCKKIQVGTVWAPDFPGNYDSEWAHSPEAQDWLAERQQPAHELLQAA